MTEVPRPEHYDPVAMLSTLSRHGVAYVVVGNTAAVLHGAPVTTNDLDVAVEQSPGNRDRLAAALADMGAVLIHPLLPPTPPRSGQDIPHGISIWMSPAGELNAFGEVLAIGGYDRIAPRSASFDIGGEVVVRAAALEDVIASKERAHRPKDDASLPVLRATLDRIRQGRSPGPRNGKGQP